MSLLKSSVISLTKRNLNSEIRKIDEKAEYITKLKNEAIQTLLEEKDNILAGVCKDPTKMPQQIDSRIKHLREQHSAVMNKYSERQTTLHEEKGEFDILGEDLDEIDVELKVIQQRHDVVMEQLDTKRAFLVERLGSVENMSRDVSDLEAALLKAKFGLETDTEILEKKKMEALENLPPSEAAIVIQKLEEEHQMKMKSIELEMKGLTEQIQGLNSLEYLQTKCLNVDEEIERLEEAKCNAATPAEAVRLDGRLKELSMQREASQKLLKMASMSSKERFIKMLEERHLYYTPSGRIQTVSGRMSVPEAMALGLLDGMNTEVAELFEVVLTDTGKIMTATGEVFEPAEAGKLGIFRGADMSQSSVTSSSSQKFTSLARVHSESSEFNISHVPVKT